MMVFSRPFNSSFFQRFSIKSKWERPSSTKLSIFFSPLRIMSMGGARIAFPVMSNPFNKTPRVDVKILTALVAALKSKWLLRSPKY